MDDGQDREPNQCVNIRTYIYRYKITSPEMIRDAIHASSPYDKHLSPYEIGCERFDPLSCPPQ